MNQLINGNGNDSGSESDSSTDSFDDLVIQPNKTDHCLQFTLLSLVFMCLALRLLSL